MRDYMKLLICLGLLLPFFCAADDFDVRFNGDAVRSEQIFCMSELGLDDPRAVLYLRDWTVLLPEPGEYQFLTDTNRPGRLFLDVGESNELVGVQIPSFFRENSKRIKREELSPHLMKSLMAVKVYDNPGVEVMSLLNHLDPNRVFFEAGEPVSFSKTTKLPAYNSAIKFMRLDGGLSYPIKVDMSSISQLKNLVYLDFKTGSKEFDLSLIKNCGELKCLRLNTFTTLNNSQSLAELSNLRFFQLSRCKGLDDIDFLTWMPLLRHLSICGLKSIVSIESVGSLSFLEELNIYHTAVTNLSPLASLENLRKVTADSTQVHRLPEASMPNLEELRILNTPVGEKEVATFQQSNPQCRVYHRWETLFRNAMSGVTRVRVRSGGTCHRDISEEKTLYETTDHAEINELIEGIDINDRESGFHCMCCGQPTFEFYKGEELFASVGFHHGLSLRWAGGEWPGDARLAEASRERVFQWLDRGGVTGPRESYEADERRREQETIERDKMASATPASLLSFFPNDSNRDFKKSEIRKMNAAFSIQFPDESERLLVLLGWYGAGGGGWSSFSSYEYAAHDLLMLLPVETVLEVCEEQPLNVNQLEGAARYWGRDEYLFAQKKMSMELKAKLLAHSQENCSDGDRFEACRAFYEFEFSPYEGYVEIDGYHGTNEVVVIPEAIEGLPVTSIASRAFGKKYYEGERGSSRFDFVVGESCTNITQIIIPAGVTNIAASAFQDCERLEAIMIHRDNACYQSVDGILLDKSGNSLVRYPAGIAASVAIPDSVTNIGPNAFRGCKSMRIIQISSSVISIESAFGECCSLTEIKVHPDNPKFCDEGGILLTKDGSTLVRFPPARKGEVMIPEGIVNIQHDAFEGYSDLISIVIPDCVTNISARTF